MLTSAGCYSAASSPTFTVDWQGIALEVSYEVRWLDLESANIAHLQVMSVGRIPLPITETGHRSHFVPAEEIAQAGGAVAYTLAWLAQAAAGRQGPPHRLYSPCLSPDP